MQTQQRYRNIIYNFCFTRYFNFNTKFRIFFILDYIIPSIGAKKFGGSKSGVIGSTLGTIIGIIFLGPIGIIIGAFLGAFVGELSKNRSNKLIAFKAAIGTLIGYLGGIILKLSIAIVFSIKFFKIILNNWNEIL